MDGFSYRVRATEKRPEGQALGMQTSKHLEDKPPVKATRKKGLKGRKIK